MRSTYVSKLSSLVILASVLRIITALNGQCSTRSVLTYNTALLDNRLSPDIPNDRLLRREAIISELRRVDADVVCLQEVWIGQDVERFVDGLSDLYKHSHSKLHIPGKYGPVLPDQTGPSMAPCPNNDIMAFLRCGRRNRCFRQQGQRIVGCLHAHCYHIYVRLPQECLTCAATSYKNRALAQRNCMGNGQPAFNMMTINTPGLLILSKTPLYNAKYTDFHPYTTETIERGFLEADTPGLGKVVCTHVTMNYPLYYEIGLSYRGVFHSFWEQGHSERTELIETFGNTKSLILAGDFNTGDRFGPLINTDLPHEYCHLAKVFDNTPVKECTLCWPHENIYTKDLKSALNTVVDHVFYKGHTNINVERVIKPTDALIIDNIPLSDHNGVKATFLVC
ncbi:hypothetical protein ACF0H5_017117 [Mactra antiquata]